jgi:hypothetical protein
MNWEHIWADRKFTSNAFLLLAGALGVSPLLLGYLANTTASVSAWASAVAVAFLAALESAMEEDAANEWTDWAIGIAGVWTVVAPWALGFAEMTTAAYTHVFIGLAVLLMAGMRLWTMSGQNPPRLTA